MNLDTLCLYDILTSVDIEKRISQTKGFGILKYYPKSS